jgi:hypothetical protein
MSESWRRLIGSAFRDAKFYAPASAQDIARAERNLGVAFPGELRELLLETNGVSAHFSAPFVWTVEEIVEQNKHFRANTSFRELYKPFDDLLFFGAEGNGDQFAYRIVNGRIPEPSIYEWDHETDVRAQFASNLSDYFKRSAPPPLTFMDRLRARFT